MIADLESEPGIAGQFGDLSVERFGRQAAQPERQSKLAGGMLQSSSGTDHRLHALAQGIIVGAAGEYVG